MRPVRTLAVAVALLIGGAWPIAGPAGPACAAEEPRAGLVVDTGARVLTLCVQLDAEEVTGLHLIELAAAQHGLTYGFGLGGAAVCRLAGVGPQGSDCFGDYPDFWAYWHGDDGAGWSWASTGAGSHTLEDGDVDGWVWGTGDTPTTHDRPPFTDFGDLCRQFAPEPSPTQQPSSPRPDAPTSPGGDGGQGRGDGSEPGSGGAPGSTPNGGSPGATGSNGSDGASPTTAFASSNLPSSTSGVTASLEAAGAGSSSAGGPPVGLFVAGAIGAALLAGGILRMRSKPGGTR